MSVKKNQFLLMVYGIYIFFFVTISCSQLVNIGILNSLNIYIQKLCLLIMLIFSVKNVFRKGIIFWAYIIAVVLLIVFYSNNGMWNLITVFAFAFSLRGISFNRVIKIDLLVRATGFMMVIFMNLIGLIDSQIAYSNRGYLRTSLGFNHANTLSLIILILCFEWIYLRFYKLKFTEYLFFSFIVYMLYFITNSLTSIIGIVCLLSFNIIARIVKKINIGYTPLSTILILVLPLSMLTSLFLSMHYSSLDSWIVKLNELSTGRIASMSSFYLEYGISLFGKPLELISTDAAEQSGVSAQVLDNGYMRLLLRFGIVITIIFLGMLLKLNYRMLKHKNFAIASCLSAFFITGLMESSFYRMEYNVFLIAIVYVFANKPDVELREKH